MISLCALNLAISQPQACGPNPIMANNCADACVICDIDGFTGTNNLQAGGQDIGNIFCSFPNDMHFIAFIAGSTSLSIRIDVSNCSNVGSFSSLDLGFYESPNCQDFFPITECFDDLPGGNFHIFTTDVPLTIGQHYYLIMDGSNGSICDWTFTVLDGTTQVNPLDASGEIILPEETCPNFPTTIMNAGESGASLYYWTVDGSAVANVSDEFQYSFPDEGEYEICVRAANACDEGPEICKTIKVREIGTLDITETLCDGECVEANGIDFCQTGIYQEIVTLANGCDSIINININVLPQPISFPDLWICSDDFFFIGNTPYNQTGNYSGTVLTENDCDSIVNLTLLVIQCEIIQTLSQVPVICNGTASGTLVFSVDQGTPPLSFTYTNIFDPTITGSGTTNLLVNNEIPNIPAGEYQVYVQDDFGNDAVETIIVTEPAPLEIELVPSNYNGYNVSCFNYFNPIDSTITPGDDGTLLANVSGGEPPYQYLWSNSQNTQTAVGLTATSFEVTVTDDVGCSIVGNYTLASPDLIDANVAFIDPNCDGFDTGIVQFQNATGGVGPYSYSFNSLNSFGQDSVYDQLLEGDYNMYVQDENACIVQVSGTLTAPDIPVIEFSNNLEIDLGDTIQLSPLLNNTSIANIEWINSATQDAFSLSCGDCLEPISYAVNDSGYVLTISSEDGCTDSESIQIEVNKIRPIYIPNIFSPDGNGNNDKFLIYSNRAVEIVEELNIFDRWGNLIFSQENFPTNDESFSWDGLFKKKKVDTGVLVYQAKIKFIDGVSLPYSGTLTLIE